MHVGKDIRVTVYAEVAEDASDIERVVLGLRALFLLRDQNLEVAADDALIQCQRESQKRQTMLPS